MKNSFNSIIEVLFWIAIFSSPLLISIAIAALLYFNNDKLIWMPIAIISAGVILGIYVAERIRRKYGCANFMGKIIGTPDIWPTEVKKNQEKRKKNE